MTIRGLLGRLLLLSLSLLLCEAVAQVARARLSVDDSYGYPQGLYVAHPSLEYGLKPGFEGFFTSAGYSRIPIEINDLGYRDRPFPRGPRQEGEHRIAFLGDSVTFGSGVRAGDRFSELVASKLDVGPVRTLNLAVNSYTFFHYEVQVREVIPQLDPDLVVVNFCLNDIAGKNTSIPRTWVKKDGEQPPPPAKRPPRHWSERSALVWMVQRIAVGLSGPREDDKNWPGKNWLKWYERVSTLWSDEKAVANLRRQMIALARELEAQDRQLLVTIPPLRYDLASPEEFGTPRRKLLALLDELEIPAADLHQAFASHPEIPRLFLRGDAIHLSGQGHQVAAEALAPHIQGLLSAANDP
jgi:lysophospholipase L1-like esterase